MRECLPIISSVRASILVTFLLLTWEARIRASSWILCKLHVWQQVRNLVNTFKAKLPRKPYGKWRHNDLIMQSIVCIMYFCYLLGTLCFIATFTKSKYIIWLILRIWRWPHYLDFYFKYSSQLRSPQGREREKDVCVCLCVYTNTILKCWREEWWNNLLYHLKQVAQLFELYYPHLQKWQQQPKWSSSGKKLRRHSSAWGLWLELLQLKKNYYCWHATLH